MLFRPVFMFAISNNQRQWTENYDQNYQCPSFLGVIEYSGQVDCGGVHGPGVVVTREGEPVQAGGGGGPGLHVVACHVAHVVRVGDPHGGTRVADPIVPVVAGVGAALSKIRNYIYMCNVGR